MHVSTLKYADREMLASDEGIAYLLSLSFAHSRGVMRASAGRVVAGAQLLLDAPNNNIELATEKATNFLERTEWLGLTSASHGLDDVRRWRLSDGVVTVLTNAGELKCDVCKLLNSTQPVVFPESTIRPAIADSRTQTGRWGYVCSSHFVTEGCELGMGKGQLIRPEAMPPQKLTYR